MLTLYRDLLVRFVKPSVIAGVQDITNISHHDTAPHLPANEIMLGFENRNYARRENLIDTSRFFKISSISFLNPNTRLSSTLKELQTLISRFPNIVSSQDMDRLFKEFREYQTCHQWKPSPRLLKSAKSAPYISLSSRRQPSSLSRSDPSAAASSESVAGPSSKAVTALGESTSSIEPSFAAVRGTSAVSSKDPSISVVSEPSACSSSEQSTAVVMESGSSKEPAAAATLKQAKLQFSKN
ncbi:hypothetical protein XELAEV_18003262mg [Xenopus laevis]|nr:hypothetical protein XELAEV_18003262mg [Xenopus laevis]